MFPKIGIDLINSRTLRTCYRFFASLLSILIGLFVVRLLALTLAPLIHVIFICDYVTQLRILCYCQYEWNGSIFLKSTFITISIKFSTNNFRFSCSLIRSLLLLLLLKRLCCMDFFPSTIGKGITFSLTVVLFIRSPSPPPFHRSPTSTSTPRYHSSSNGWNKTNKFHYEI